MLFGLVWSLGFVALRKGGGIVYLGFIIQMVGLFFCQVTEISDGFILNIRLWLRVPC